jgi:hypothetical protein
VIEKGCYDDNGNLLTKQDAHGSIKRTLVETICGSSPGKKLAWTMTRKAAYGAVKGAVGAGEFGTVGGGFVGLVAGAGGGAITGGFTVAICGGLGAYRH